MKELIIDIIINTLDVIVTYYLCRNIVGRELKITGKRISIGLIMGIFCGICSYYFDIYTYKVVVTVTMLVLIRYYTGERIHDVLIIYMICYLCVVPVQVVVLLIMNNISIEESMWYLIAQTMASTGALCVSYKISLYKIFNTIEREILLKLIIYSLFIIFFGFTAYFDFQYDNLLPYSNYFIVFFIVSLAGFYQTTKRIFFYTNKVPVQLHDVKNVLFGLSISAQNTSDINKIQEEINSAIEILGIDVDVNSIDTDSHNSSIEQFLIKKAKKHNMENLVMSSIHYYEDHNNITFSTILYILGVLIDNALEHNSDQPILVKVSVTYESAIISVSNAYERKSSNDFERMFQKGYSTKSSGGRGYGLFHLKEVVNSNRGEIFLDYSYNVEYENDYLKIIIEI